MDRDNVSSVNIPGVPVDLQATKKSGPISSMKRGKDSTVSALLATPRSTASMGRFDKMREDEPERKKMLRKQNTRVQLERSFRRMNENEV